MEIIIDGQASHELEGSPKDVYAVVGAITEHLHGLGKGIVSLSIDGDDILPADLPEKTLDRPLSGVQRIEVVSATLRMLAEEVLRELIKVLPELPQACTMLAQTFQGEDPESGFDPFQELAGLWLDVKHRESEVMRALEISESGLDLDGLSFEELHEELNGFLEEAGAAIAGRDYVLLGDLLEYELAPRAEMESGIVARLAQEAGLDLG